MKCPNCKSENIQVVSEYIETDKKEISIFFSILTIIVIIALCLSGILCICALMLKHGDPTAIGILAICPKIVYISAGYLIIVKLFKLLQPFKHETRTKAVCMDCSNMWLIKPLKVKQPVATPAATAEKQSEEDNVLQ